MESILEEERGPLVDPAEASGGDLVPVVGFRLATIEEVDHEIGGLVGMVGIDVESGDAVLDNLRRAPMAGREGW